jgi:hypothetical protein
LQVRAPLCNASVKQAGENAENAEIAEDAENFLKTFSVFSYFSVFSVLSGSLRRSHAFENHYKRRWNWTPRRKQR